MKICLTDSSFPVFTTSSPLQEPHLSFLCTAPRLLHCVILFLVQCKVTEKNSLKLWLFNSLLLWLRLSIVTFKCTMELLPQFHTNISLVKFTKDTSSPNLMSSSIASSYFINLWHLKILMTLFFSTLFFGNSFRPKKKMFNLGIPKGFYFGALFSLVYKICLTPKRINK